MYTYTYIHRLIFTIRVIFNLQVEENSIKYEIAEVLHLSLLVNKNGLKEWVKLNYKGSEQVYNLTHSPIAKYYI